MFADIKAVIFDLDGTLIDSMWLWKAIDIEYLERFSIPLPDDLQKSIEGMSFSETAEYFKERFKIPHDVEQIKNDWNELAAIYYSERVPLKEHVVILLEELTKRGIKLGIGTSNSKELVSLIVDKFELHKYFDSIRTSCEVEKGKPHPDIFLKVAEDLGVHHKECLVFEDIPNGLMAARNAQMRPVAIYDDFSKKMNNEKKELADYFIHSYQEAIEALGIV